MLKWIIIAIAAWWGFFGLRLILRRAMLVRRLERFCREKKLRLHWARPWYASLFSGLGEIDFVIDACIHVAILSHLRRRVQFQIGADRIEFVRIRLLRTATGTRTRASLSRGTVDTSVVGHAPLALATCDVPSTDARVLLVHPAPTAVNDCSGSQSRPIWPGDATVGGFQLNTRTTLFERLETYAETGDLSVWRAVESKRKWD